MLAELEQARQLATRILEDREEAMRKRSAELAHEPNFAVGDTLYLYNPEIKPGNSKKLSRPWTGPYYIVEKLSRFIYMYVCAAMKVTAQ